MTEQLRKTLGTGFVDELIAFLQKFEIILLLNENCLLVPSLLPPDESDCLCLPMTPSTDNYNFSGSFMSKHMASGSKQSSSPTYETSHPVLVRYYLLSFIPNAFFAHVIARLMSANILAQFLQSVVSESIVCTHWKCWRDGIAIILNGMEVFRVALTSFPLQGTTETHVISNVGAKKIDPNYKGVEIKSVILPEETFEDPALTCKGKRIATSLLLQATMVIESVFENWYKAFSEFEDVNGQVVNPCTECIKLVHESLCQTSTTARSRSKTRLDGVFMFSSPFCCQQVAEGKDLHCPMEHGRLLTSDVAPDLVFCDLPSSKVFTNPKCLEINKEYPLGRGGFGSVYRALLRQVSPNLFSH